MRTVVSSLRGNAYSRVHCVLMRTVVGTMRANAYSSWYSAG